MSGRTAWASEQRTDDMKYTTFEVPTSNTILPSSISATGLPEDTQLRELCPYHLLPNSTGIFRLTSPFIKILIHLGEKKATTDKP